MSSTGTELTRTTVGSVTNQYKWTYSFWVKRTDLGTGATNSFIFDWFQSSSNRGGILFENDNTLKIYDRVSNANALDKRTNRVFRDINAWYHIVIAHDRSISSPVTKIYVNGVEETSLMSSTDPSQNGTSYFNTTSQTERIGNYGNGSEYSQMIMSHVHFCDGYYYQASDFGETDSTTGEWKIKTSPSVSYGNNGYFILKDGNSLTDQSPNTNNFTVAGGTLTKTEDCPSNVFATWNALTNTGLTLQNGNTYTVYASNDHNCKTTLGMNSGKYYWEMKPNGVSGTVSGICRDTTKQQADISNTSGEHVYGMQYNSPNVSYKTNGTFTSSSSWGTYVSGDIVQFAYDADNGKLFIGKNGTYKDFSGNTGDPVNGTYPTFSSLDTTATWFPFIEMRGGSENDYWNFGNGYFGTTAVSSAGTNASGNGIFEYDVPTGYTALSTKGLNE